MACKCMQHKFTLPASSAKVVCDACVQVALRLHRLGTLHLAAGRSGEAVRLLGQSCPSFIRNVGESNPLTGKKLVAYSCRNF